jgi:spermidine/putrescine ABC transporter ATP-binding subunit
MAPDPVLRLEGVAKKYGDAHAVGPVDIDVVPGEFLTLLGPSGCGKTTTLHIIAGLLEPTAGRVTIAGRDVTHVEPRRRDMGLVFQNYALFPHKTIFDNVAFGLRMRKVARPEIRERVRRMLDIVGLPGVESRVPDQLSGGQRQRVALARALVIEPTVLLLDEPLSNLDAVLRKRMRLELRDLQRRLGITTIFVTHDQDEAFEMSDRIVLLNAGRIEQIGSPEEIYDAPASRFVAEFIGNVNLIDGRVLRVDGNGGAIVGIAGNLEVKARLGALDLGEGSSTHLMIRPERIELSAGEPAGRPAFAARVRKRVFSGEHLTFELEAAAGTGLLCTKPSIPVYRAIAPGDTVWLTLEGCRALPTGASPP